MGEMPLMRFLPEVTLPGRHRLASVEQPRRPVRAPRFSERRFPLPALMRCAREDTPMKLRFIALLVAALMPHGAGAQDTVTVFAAASLKNALDDVNAAFTAQTSIKVRSSYAASSALARQLDAGAPADVFLSAD